jgi:hypothetical protein
MYKIKLGTTRTIIDPYGSDYLTFTGLHLGDIEVILKLLNSSISLSNAGHKEKIKW